MSSLPPYNRSDAELTIHLVPTEGLEAALRCLGEPSGVLAAAGADAAELRTRRGVVVIHGVEAELARLLRELLGGSPDRPPVRFPADGGAELLVSGDRVTLRALNRGTGLSS